MSVDTLYKTLTQSNVPDEQAGQGQGVVGAQHRRRPGRRGWSGLGPGRPGSAFVKRRRTGGNQSGSGGWPAQNLAVGITHPPKDGLRSAFRLYRDQ